MAALGAPPVALVPAEDSVPEPLKAAEYAQQKKDDFLYRYKDQRERERERERERARASHDCTKYRRGTKAMCMRETTCEKKTK